MIKSDNSNIKQLGELFLNKNFINIFKNWDDFNILISEN